MSEGNWIVLMVFLLCAAGLGGVMYYIAASATQGHRESSENDKRKTASEKHPECLSMQLQCRLGASG